jgi:hypothetical protein
MRSPTDRGANRDAASNVRAGSIPIVPPSLRAETFSRPRPERCRPALGRADPDLCRRSLAVAPVRLFHPASRSSGGVDVDVLKEPGDGQGGRDAVTVNKRSPAPGPICSVWARDCAARGPHVRGRGLRRTPTTIAPSWGRGHRYAGDPAPSLAGGPALVGVVLERNAEAYPECFGQTVVTDCDVLLDDLRDT